MSEELLSSLVTELKKPGGGPGCVQLLRQLLVSVKTGRQSVSRLSDALLQNLVALLLKPPAPAASKSQASASWVAKLLCSLVIQETLPWETSDVSIAIDISGLHDSGLTNCLPVLLLQKWNDREFFIALAPQLVRWIATVGYSEETRGHSLSTAVSVKAYHPDIFSKEHVHVISVQLSDWLMHAGLQQSPNPYASRLFKKDSEQQPLVTEIDGTPCKDFFTVLCIGQYYTSEQILSNLGFSLLRQWLVSCSKTDFAPLPQDETAVSPIKSEAPSDHRDNLSGSAMQYALRLITQCSKKSKLQQDDSLQQACLVEAISILDDLCTSDPLLAPQVTDVVYDVAKASTQQPRILLACLQFFLHHDSLNKEKTNTLWDTFFTRILSTQYSSPGVAFDLIQLIQDNLETICHHTDVLSRYFPAILKVLAWDPRCYFKEFIDILPAIMSPTAALEVFHCLLDLPCLTASLILEQQSTGTTRETAATTWPRAMAALSSPQHQPFFKFILRNEAGHGDTVNRLNILHEALAELNNHPRVVTTADTIPALLNVYLGVLESEGNDELCNSLVPVLLERTSLLYDIHPFKQQVQKQLSEATAFLLRLHPRLVVAQYDEIREYLGATRTASDTDLLFTNLVWAVGEFLSPHYNPSVTPDMISKMYETLETVSYETTKRSEHKPPPRLVSSIMSTLAKLASRSQDLIPRAILCLTRLRQQHSGQDEEGASVLQGRANELINLLQMPNVAAMILSPEKEIESGRWHLDNQSVPFLLRTVNKYLHTGKH